MKAQEKRAVDQAEQLLEQVRREIGELKSSEAELNKLTTVEDSIQFLQVSSSLFLSICFQVSYKHFRRHVQPGLPPVTRVARLSKLRLCSQRCLRWLASLV